jgi:flagellar basal-body rod modification protein FlgD
MTTVSGTTGTTGTTATSSTAALNPLAQNFDMFLTLLTTQMKNQDPLSPMDSTQFTQQLVQMTGVEQQLAANDLLKQLVANTGTSVASAVDLIGKQVQVTTTTAQLKNGQAAWQYNLGPGATNVKIEVLDANGNTVNAYGPTDYTAGAHSFTWDGRNMNGKQMADGAYTLRITATDATKAAVSATPFIQGVVTGVEQTDAGTMLTVNGGTVPLSGVTSVTAPATTTTASGGATASGANTNNPADQTSAAAA